MVFLLCDSTLVSIRASARDAISDAGREPRVSIRFQSAHLCEVRCQDTIAAFKQSGVSIRASTWDAMVVKVHNSVMAHKFQSVHLHEVRYRQKNSYMRCLRFNPHTHERCDDLQCLGAMMRNSFNPRTRVGCDS